MIPEGRNFSIQGYLNLFGVEEAEKNPCTGIYLILNEYLDGHK